MKPRALFFNNDNLFIAQKKENKIWLEKLKSIKCIFTYSFLYGIYGKLSWRELNRFKFPRIFIEKNWIRDIIQNK